MSDDLVDGDPFDPQYVAAVEAEQKKAGENTDAEARALLVRRKTAYANVFKAGKRDGADVDIVLNDLMYFCKVWVPTYDRRDGAQAAELSLIKEGRREVFQRIKDFSCLDADTLLLKYTDATTK